MSGLTVWEKREEGGSLSVEVAAERMEFHVGGYTLWQGRNTFVSAHIEAGKFPLQFRDAIRDALDRGRADGYEARGSVGSLNISVKRVSEDKFTVKLYAQQEPVGVPAEFNASREELEDLQRKIDWFWLG